MQRRKLSSKPAKWAPDSRKWVLCSLSISLCFRIKNMVKNTMQRELFNLIISNDSGSKFEEGSSPCYHKQKLTLEIRPQSAAVCNNVVFHDFVKKL